MRVLHKSLVTAIVLAGVLALAVGYEEQTVGNTTYVITGTQNLPMLQPFRDMGIPAPILDFIQPTLRVLVELGYNRAISMGASTPAEFLPFNPSLLLPPNMVKLGESLVSAVEQGTRAALADLNITLPTEAQVRTALTALTKQATPAQSKDVKAGVTADAANAVTKNATANTDTKADTKTSRVADALTPSAIVSKNGDGGPGKSRSHDTSSTGTDKSTDTTAGSSTSKISSHNATQQSTGSASDNHGHQGVSTNGTGGAHATGSGSHSGGGGGSHASHDGGGGSHSGH